MKCPWRSATIIHVLFVCFTTVIAHSLSRGPLNYLSTIEKAVIRTPSHRVHAFSNFDLIFSLHQGQQRVKLTLEPNHDILVDGASVNYLDSDGNEYHREYIDRSEHKVFKGDAWVQQHDQSWTNIGWARIVVRRDGVKPLFEGAFTIMHNHHHVQLRHNYIRTRLEQDPMVEDSDDEYMVVFRDSDSAPTQNMELKRSEEGLSCQSHELSFNSDLSHPLFSGPVLKRSTGSWGSMPIGSLFGKRQVDGTGLPSGGNSGGVNLTTTIGNPTGCPNTRKVALIGVATDCGYTGSFNSSQTARQNVINQINSASSVYEKTFNITLGLQNLTISDSNCPGTAPPATPWNIGCSSNTNISTRLNTFSQWRGNRNDSNAYWTLLTNCPTGAEVGLAWLGQACVNTVQTAPGEIISGANVVAKTPTEWQVIAHESGHTFGAVHDCIDQTCDDGVTVKAQQCCPLSTTQCSAQNNPFIMNPSTGSQISAFSACSVGNICSALGRNMVKSSCFSDNKGVATITGQQCGNGIVEPGEDCDCGGVSSCGNDTCCDATTCKFKNGAVCDEFNDECCQNCQFASAGAICRPSTGTCDPQEVCPGNAATCPPDQQAPNGQSCGSSLECASGQCTSRDLQCKTLMGSYTTDNDTYACNSQDCTLSCASPEFGPGECYSMQQNFLDGTPCGGGGSCSNGQCQGSSTAKEVGSWIDDNKKLVIGLAVGIGVLLLLMILGCIVRCCRTRRRPKRARRINSPPTQKPWGPPPQQSGWVGSQPSGWNGNKAWEGPPPPIPPPHTYVPRSVRYA